MAEPLAYEDFAKMELRVAKVLEARPHPNADKLLLLQIDVGDDAEADRGRHPPALHARATRRQAHRRRQQPRPRDAPGRDVQRHAPGRDLGREGRPADGRRPRVRCRGEDQVTNDDATSADLGDFQTPPALVAAVLDALGPIGARWPRVLEPTCGRGDFLSGLIGRDDPPREIRGFEIQPAHVARVPGRSPGLTSVDVEVRQANLFDLDLRAT